MDRRHLTNCYVILYVFVSEYVFKWLCGILVLFSVRYCRIFFTQKKSIPGMHGKIRASANMCKCLVTCFCIMSFPYCVFLDR